jgi:uncharacterized protein
VIPSAFNLYVPGLPEAGSTLIHNTFSGAYVVLDSSIADALQQLGTGAPVDSAARAALDDPELCDPDVGVIVASRDAEEAAFRDWFERRRSLTDTLTVVVGVNLACNFACPYCCQAQVLDGAVMSEATADATVEWITTHALGHAMRAIHPIFVGGEPLLHPARIEHVARRLRAALSPAGIDVGFSIVTNGYFLDPPMVDRLAELGLRGAKITLDGDATTHARTRVSKRGEDTFERVFANLIAASRRIRVTVNGNYRDDTVHGFEPLLRKLRAAGLPPGSEVAFSPALSGLSADEGVGPCNWSAATDYQHALADATMRQGFRARELHAVGPCALHDRHSFAVDPDGTVHKCPGFMGHPSWAIGDVRTGLGPRYGQMLGATPSRECDGCAHRPNCGGGCVAAAWLKSGRIGGVSCEHDYFERVKRPALLREYLLAIHDDRDAAMAAFPPAERPLPAEPHAPIAPSGRRSAALNILAAKQGALA